MKKCRKCIYFPCLRSECKIDNENVCEHYKTEVSKMIEEETDRSGHKRTVMNRSIKND